MKTEILSYNVDERGGVFIGHAPIAKPRQTQSDKWKKRPAVMRYRAYKDILNLINNRLSGRLTDILDSGTVQLVFYMPIPKSRKEEPGDPHKVRPDIDNLQKAVFDALCKNDAHIHYVETSKVYSERAGLYISGVAE